jgi:selenophosphate synthetase-related protein
MRSLTLASLIVALAPGTVHAGPFCDQLRGASVEKQGAYVLLMVDEMLKSWPQHDQFKRITSDAERLAMFADARRKIVSECAAGKDFAAGVALGEDLAIYKVSLLQVGEGLKGIPEQ